MAERETPEPCAQCARYSLHVKYDEGEFLRLVQEVRDGTVAQVHMSLFSFWIREKPANYEQAKQHIRELGLPQDFCTDRIQNEFVRRLVDEAYDLRPEWKSPPPNSPLTLEEAGEILGAGPDEDPKPLATPGFKSTTSSQPLQSPSPRPSGTTSPSVHSSLPKKSKVPWISKIMPRSPSRNAPALPTSPPASLGRSSLSSSNTVFGSLGRMKLAFSRSEVNVSDFSTSPPPGTAKPQPRSSGYPPKPKTPSKPSAKSSIIPPPASARYGVLPPDTPDRPAPLNIKPRSGDPQSATTGTRAVSTPLQNAIKEAAPSPLQTTKTVTRAVSTPQLATPCQPSGTPRFACSPHIFGSKTPEPNHNIRAGEPQPEASTRGPSLSRISEVGDFPPEELDSLFAEFGLPSQATTQPIAESEHEDGAAQPDRQRNEMGEAEGDSSVTRIAYHYVSSLRAESTVKADDLESISEDNYPTASDIFRGPGSRLGFIAHAAPTPAERRAAAQARRAARAIHPDSPTMPDFHRPLPLRTYESQPSLYLTAHAQRMQHHMQSTSLDESPPRPRPLQAGGTAERPQELRRSNLQTQVPLSVDPLKTAGPATEPELLHSVDLSQFPDVPTLAGSTGTVSPDDVYRSVTETYMKQALDRTRARGTQLAVVNMRAIPSFECAWRTVNEQLLIAIYGRNDIVLTETDVSLVDKISKELSHGVGKIAGYEWVGALFQRSRQLLD